MEINLEIRPLIIMEGSVLGYSKISNDQEAYEYIVDMIDRCFSVQGCFSMLWHNSDLQTPERQNLYLQIMNYCASLQVKSKE